MSTGDGDLPIPKLNPITIPNNNIQAERPPLLKKSRTISTTAAAVDDSRPPQFPSSVRRLSPSPSWSTRSFDSDTSSPSTTTNDSFFATQTSSFNFSDRDYVYPSFLGASTVRNCVTVKSSASAKSQRRDLSVSQAPSLVSFGGVSGKGVELVQPSLVRGNSSAYLSESESESKPKRDSKVERENKLVPAQISVPAVSSSSLNSTISRPRRKFPGIKRK